MEPRQVTFKLQILVVDIKIRGVPNLSEKALHLTRLTAGMNW
jgi:hypothetical protein